MLAALAHQGHPRFDQIAEVLLGLLARIDEEAAATYYDTLVTSLNDSPRKLLESTMTVMTPPFGSSIAKRALEEGREEGREQGAILNAREAVFSVLKVRHLTVTDEFSERIEACTDLDRLKTWHNRAVTAAKADEIFR